MKKEEKYVPPCGIKSTMLSRCYHCKDCHHGSDCKIAVPGSGTAQAGAANKQYA